MRWRTGLKTGDAAEKQAFTNPEDLWAWVTDFCKPKTRTVVWAHNLSYDLRISRAMDILPSLGWRLDWCNLGSQVSTMTWRSDRGTVTFADLTSWLPMRLEEVGELVGIEKGRMPGWREGRGAWREYCMRDVEILAAAVKEIVRFVDSEDLGNWQPTGAGMAFATWRHKFLEYKVLVHDDEDALTAERKAMHTGRAEAWRHGKITKGQWAEVDLRQAYVHIAKEYDLPCKLKYHNGPITLAQYRELGRRYRVLCRAEVRTSVPCVPCHSGGREVWPVGRFQTWLWDCELDIAIRDADEVRIKECYVYTKAPLLSNWASWVLEVQGRDDDAATPAVRKWIKHSGRTLIGRIALRTAQWAVWGANPEGESGISYVVDAETGKVNRLMHVGDQTHVEEARVEGRDSLPQITGWVMAQCRVWLWEAMCAAGEENIAHVDTDSVLVNTEGLGRLIQHYGPQFASMWQVKATYRSLRVDGTRNYRAGIDRKLSGVPTGAVETAPGRFEGQTWSSFGKDLSRGETGSVTITDKVWNVKAEDPRRVKLPGASTATRPYRIDQTSKSSSAA